MYVKTKLFSVTKNDIKMQTFRCSGNGGQNVNKRDTGVRFIHEPSGARGEACDTRHQAKNKELAFKRLAESEVFNKWLRVEAARRLGDIDRRVEEQMKEMNLKVEYYPV